METIALVVAAAGALISLITLVLVIMIKNSVNQEGSARLEQELAALKADIERLSRDNTESQSSLRQEINGNVNTAIKNLGDQLRENQEQASAAQVQRIKDMAAQLAEMNQTQNARLEAVSKAQNEKLDTMTQKLAEMNASQISRMNDTASAQNAMLETMQKKLVDMLLAQSESAQKAAAAQTERLETINRTQRERIDALGKAQAEHSSEQRGRIVSAGEAQREQIEAMSRAVNQKLTDMSNRLTEQLKQFETRFGTLEQTTEQKLENIRKTVAEQLAKMTEDNNRQLDKIRGTVDEKLQDTLEKKMNESFKLVSERLEQVYKGLGEMQSIAEGVGDLKSVLSNVKTRGILGEIQLGAILKEILAPGQYEENIATVPKSTERVEFAVRLPGGADGEPVFLPIDSKFNGDRYVRLQSAYESGDKAEIDAAKKELEIAIKKNAKDIRDKYISPPYTTNFGIMFLPFEGLYAEVVNSGLVDVLQRDYNINIAGPSTMAALLNSLQMGFKTLAIQKRSGDVWKILGAVKTEFQTFEKVLTDAQEKLRKTEDTLEKLVGVRTRQMNRKLSEVETLDHEESVRLLDN